jgi:hypothetical protein
VYLAATTISEQFPTTGSETGRETGRNRQERQQEQAYMMPRMDPRTQLKRDRGGGGYTATVASVGGGSGSFSVVRIASRRIRRRAVDRHHSADLSTIVDKTVSNRVRHFDHHETPLRPSSSGVRVHHRAKMSTMVDKIGSRRSSCDSHHLAEMSTMVDKTCLVSESFGSNSVASLYPCRPAKLASVSGR